MNPLAIVTLGMESYIPAPIIAQPLTIVLEDIIYLTI